MTKGEGEGLEDAEESGKERELIEEAMLSTEGLSREDSDMLTRQQVVSRFNRRWEAALSSSAHPLPL